MKNKRLLALGLIAAVLAVSVGVAYLVSGQDLLASTFFRNDIYATNITANSTMKSGNAEVNSNISVKGRGDIRGDLNVQGSAWVNDNLTVNGQTTLNNNVLVNGEVNVSQTISAQALKLGGQLLNLSNLVTTQNVQNVVSNILASMNLAQYIDLTSYATKVYVDSAIAALSIPSPAEVQALIDTSISNIELKSAFSQNTEPNGSVQEDGRTLLLRKGECPTGTYMFGINYTEDVSGNYVRIDSVKCSYF